MTVHVRWLSIGIVVVGLLGLSPLGAWGQFSPSIPLIGHSYASTTSGGFRFVGAIDIEQFAATENSEVIATGALKAWGWTYPTQFPVRVKQATCDILQLEVGPPPLFELQQPLLLTTQQGSGELRRADLCKISAAASASDIPALVALLNEQALLDAGFLGGNSCPWYEAVECSAALAACAASCIDPLDGICEACFEEIGGEADCFDCLFN